MTISVVQTKAANSLTVTLASPTTAGNCLIVCVASLNATTPASISGITLGGSADNFAAAVSNTAQTASAFIWVDPNCAGGQTSVVISGSHLTVSAGNGGVIVYEVSGLAASSVADKTSSSNAASGTTWTSAATATTTQASEFWVGVADAFNPVGPSSPWSNTAAGTSAIAGQQIVSSTGTATYNGTCTNTGPVAAAVATFKANVTSAISGSDTGSGADGGSVAATLSGAETGAGADAATVGAAGADAGSAADTGSLTAAVPGAETAAGTESQAIAVASADTSAGADAGSATLGATSADTATGAEAGSVTAVALTSGDTGAGAESTSIAATTASSDAGTGADAGTVGIRSGDTGSAVSEQATQEPYIRPPIVLWDAPDKLSTRGGTMA